MSIGLLTPPITAFTPSSSTLMSADDFFAKFENQRMELVRGIVREMPMPDYLHGKTCLRMGRYLDEFAEKNNLGHVMSNDSFIRIRRNPDSVFGADVCFVSFKQMPKGPIPKGLLDIVPELVVEVRSPSDSWTDLIAKVLDYLAAGVTAVVVVNPEKRAVAVYRSQSDELQLTDQDILTLPDVLPGFELPIAKLFE